MNVSSNFYYLKMKWQLRMWQLRMNNVGTIPYDCRVHPNNIPKQKWREVFVDFIIGLPLFEGKGAIFVVIIVLSIMLIWFPQLQVYNF